MTVNDGLVHSKFTLNGISYNTTELKELSYDLVKEGSAFEKSIGSFLSNWLDKKPAIEVKTSGSTGIPKNILLQKKHMTNSALATGSYFNLEEGKSALLCLPADYIAGKMMLVRAMILGLELDYIEPSSNPLVGISKNYDFGAMVPLQLENSLDSLENIKTLLVGGAALSQVLKLKVQNKSTAVFETYGMTETSTHVAVKQTNAVDALDGSCFNAIPHVTFSTDARNCLVVSAHKVADQSIITNDLVNLISNTEFELLGRYDNAINSGGIKLIPEQIEAKLTEYISNRFFVAGIPDEKLGQKLVLIVEGEIDSNALMQTIAEKDGFERFEVPKKIYTLPKFLETDTGKIRRIENLRLIQK